MNSHYLDQIVKKLLWLSERLMSELDTTSENFWDAHMAFIFGRIDALVDLAQQQRRDLVAIHGLAGELWIDPWVFRQRNFSNMIETDPFLPGGIREDVSVFYSKRVSGMAEGYIETMKEFCRLLEEGKVADSSEDTKIEWWVKLNEAYKRYDCDFEQMHRGILHLRGTIEKYLIGLP